MTDDRQTKDAASEGTSASHCSAADARRLGLHEAICRCPKCRGETDKTKLCVTCRAVDAGIDSNQPNISIREIEEQANATHGGTRYEQG